MPPGVLVLVLVAACAPARPRSPGVAVAYDVTEDDACDVDACYDACLEDCDLVCEDDACWAACEGLCEQECDDACWEP